MTSQTTADARLTAANVRSGYDERTVLEDLSISIPDGSFTVIMGPNACGKSTLLRSLARLLKPTSGRILLDGESIHTMPAKVLARTVGLLPQSAIAPEGITVYDLVSRGRYPHQSLLRRWSSEDEEAVQAALTDTHLTELAHREVDSLSGGQRQRAWIAMALAQETPLLLLDEPTTFLDIAHQIEVLQLCSRLQRQGRTLVAVLHDINQVLRYATHIVALKDGRILAEGTAEDVGKAEVIKEVFGVEATIMADPETGKPLMIPKAPVEA